MPFCDVKRFDVFLVNLDPTIGSEIAKSRPCVVISPDEMNKHINTVLVAPLTSSVRGWPSRVPSLFEGTQGEIALDQIRAVDKRRLSKRLGQVDPHIQNAILTTLAHMFAP
jgi:mRNA interferase MazF